MKKICFVADTAGRDEFFQAIAQSMSEKYKVHTSFFAFQRRPIAYLKSKGVKSQDIYFLNIHTWQKEKLDINFLKDREKKYGFPNLWKFWTSMRETKYDSHDEALRMMQYQIKLIESFIKKSKVDVLIGDAVASLPMLLLEKIASYHGIDYLQTFISKVPGKTILRKGSNDNWFQAEKKLKELRKRKLTAEERKKAEKFVHDFLHKKEVPTYTKFNNKKKAFSLKSLKLYLIYLRDFYFYKGYEYYRDTSLLAPLKTLVYRVFRPFKRKFIEMWSPWEKPKKGEKFVLFPLHFQPEASTMVYAPFYIDQINLAMTLAKSLPVGYKLYVKEHKMGFEKRKLSFFNEIKKYPSIKFIDPFAPIHNLIKDASMVVAITNTTGWEALFYEKPVLVYGDTFYNMTTLVKRPVRADKMPELIMEMLTNHKHDHEELLKFVTALDQASYDGLSRLPAFCEGKSMTKENLEKMGEILNTELKLPKK